MARLTFPQPGDLPDAAYFASLIGRRQSATVRGLGFSADFSVPELTVAAGKAIVNRGNMTTSHPNISPAETVTDANAIVEIDSQTVSLASSTTNHIFLDANVSNDDSAQVVANTLNSPPTTASFKIGEVDTSGNTVSEGWNRLAGSGILSFPDRPAANSYESNLDNGTVIFIRNFGELFYVS
jgi:hypothetical protein